MVSWPSRQIQVTVLVEVHEAGLTTASQGLGGTPGPGLELRCGTSRIQPQLVGLDAGPARGAEGAVEVGQAGGVDISGGTGVPVAPAEAQPGLAEATHAVVEIELCPGPVAAEEEVVAPIAIEVSHGRAP